MKNKLEYLSDKDLAYIIKKTEEEGITKAPGDMKNSIIQKIKDRQRLKKNEFIIYSIKVSLSAAACIGILFAMPSTPIGITERNMKLGEKISNSISIEKIKDGENLEINQIFNTIKNNINKISGE